MSVDEKMHGNSLDMRQPWPRQLIMWNHDTQCWRKRNEENVLKKIKYVAISYRQADWDRAVLEACIRPLIGPLLPHSMDPPAYWLDVACMGPDVKELTHDLYRMADVFKYSTKVLVVIQDRADGWQRWGERVWTLPEALLGCKKLSYVVFGKNFEPVIDLRKVANLAYRFDDQEEMRLIDAFGYDYPHTVAERLEFGYTAICKRTIGLGTDGKLAGFKADRIYALMGIFDMRIKPDPEENEGTAFTRLAKKLNVSARLVDGVSSGEHHPSQFTVCGNHRFAEEGVEEKQKLMTAISSMHLGSGAVPDLTQPRATAAYDNYIEGESQEDEVTRALSRDHTSPLRNTVNSLNSSQHSNQSPVHGHRSAVQVDAEDDHLGDFAEAASQFAHPNQARIGTPQSLGSVSPMSRESIESHLSPPPSSEYPPHRRSIPSNNSRNDLSISRPVPSQSGSRSQLPDARIATGAADIQTGNLRSVEVESKSTRNSLQSSHEVKIVIKYHSDKRDASNSYRISQREPRAPRTNSVAFLNPVTIKPLSADAESIISAAPIPVRRSSVRAFSVRRGASSVNESTIHHERSSSPTYIPHDQHPSFPSTYLSDRSTVIIDDSRNFDVSRAAHPRRLKIYDIASNTWTECENKDVLADVKYLACSYSHIDFPSERKENIERHVQDVCASKGINAYWVDFLCLDVPDSMKKNDLYRMSDIYRGAEFAVILIPAEYWSNWREALWSLPAVLLSQRVVVCEIDTGDQSKSWETTLNDIKKLVYSDSLEATALIDAFVSDTNNTQYLLADRVKLLRNALWKHSDKSSAPAVQDSAFSNYPAERVYAIMGFMQYRIIPDTEENERKAWRRLMDAIRLPRDYLIKDT